MFAMPGRDEGVSVSSLIGLGRLWPPSRKQRRHHRPYELEGVQVLHRGIATRAFRQVFNLADYVRVSGANLENGLLTVELKREVPEAMKPRRIEIAASQGAQPVGQDNQPHRIESTKAA
jgi:hypothetical protein